jgi:hypothetical protein
MESCQISRKLRVDYIHYRLHIHTHNHKYKIASVINSGGALSLHFEDMSIEFLLVPVSLDFSVVLSHRITTITLLIFT